jgi:hypothetical protein
MNPARRRKGVLRAKRIMQIWDQCGIEYAREGLKTQIAHLMVRTRKRCSCEGCGNARKWHGRKLQEKKAADSFRDQLEGLAA